MYTVYFIKGPHCFKVGYTKDIKNRLRHIQNGNQEKLELIGEVLLSDKESAKIVEKSIHQFLRKYRLKGEWFKLTNLAYSVIEALQENSKEAIESMSTCSRFMDGSDNVQ